MIDKFHIIFLLLIIGGVTSWKLVWEDEFDDNNLDLKKWAYDYGENWFHNELQAYTNSTRNVFLKDSKLYLRAYKEKYGSKNYTSGRIFTRYTASWYTGRFEAKMKMPSGMGMWPAFWLLPVWLEWPLYGEIDIMEFLGKQPHIQYGTAHYANNYFRLRSKGGTYNSPIMLNDTFNIYAVEWYPDKLKFYFNDINYFTFHKEDRLKNEFWPFDKKIPFYIILNLAIGGGWPGPPDNTTMFPQDFIVEYVKVFTN